MKESKKNDTNLSPLSFTPTRYEITHIVCNSSQIKEGILNVIKIIPVSHSLVVKISKKTPFIISCIVLNENDVPSNTNIDLIFFAGQPSWWAKSYPLQKTAIIIGNVKIFKNQIAIIHPQKMQNSNVFQNGQKTLITPVYSKALTKTTDTNAQKQILNSISSIQTPKNLMIEFASQEKYVNFLQEFYEKNDIKKIAVTGTNGKTSTVHFCAMLCSLIGEKSATIGTNGVCVYENGTITSQETIGLTTATLTHNYGIINNLHKQKVKFLFMEASSIGLHQGRLDGIMFDVSCFTNLTQDHLDYHKTMEEYLHQKTRLFEEFTKKDGTIILNSDDESSKIIAQKTKIKTIFYSKNTGIIEKYTQTNDGFSLKIAGKAVNFFAHGIFQVSNLACVINVMLSLGFKIEEIAKQIPKLKPPLGRMEAVNVNGVNVLIDYAHTPDALLNILQSINGKKILVFGCGGNRDKTKRPIMGKIASENADFVIITSDNPRTEKPEEIANDIKNGITKNNYNIILERKDAIKHALSIAKNGDYVIIAGKGNEDYQEINGTKFPFKDLDVVKTLINP